MRLLILLLIPFLSNAQKARPIMLSTPHEHMEHIPGVVPVPDSNTIVCGGDGSLMPEPPYYVNKYLAENIVYPQAAKDSSLDGRVIVGFIVTETGAIDSAYIFRGVHPLLDAEALRVVKKMPPWKPGKLQGKPARIHFKMPVTFNAE